MTAASILIIEDNPADVELLQEAFNGLPHQPDLIWHTNVISALEFLACCELGKLPQLIVTDHHLPDHSGQHLIKQLNGRELWSRINVVMLSGDLDIPTSINSSKWLSKPCTWDAWQQLASDLAENAERAAI